MPRMMRPAAIKYVSDQFKVQSRSALSVWELDSPRKVTTLMEAVKTSDSPNHRTEHMLRDTIANKPTVIVTAGVRSVQ